MALYVVCNVVSVGSSVVVGVVVFGVLLVVVLYFGMFWGWLV